jgi:nucleoid DNA-binding protein
MGDETMKISHPEGQPLEGKLPENQPLEGKLSAGQSLDGKLPENQPLEGKLSADQPFEGKRAKRKQKATLYRSYFAEVVFELMGAVDRDAADAIVKDLIDVIVKGIGRDGVLKIRKFGSFRVYRRRESRYPYFNPHIPHSKVRISPAHNVVFFRSARVLKTRLNPQSHPYNSPATLPQQRTTANGHPVSQPRMAVPAPPPGAA